MMVFFLKQHWRERMGNIRHGALRGEGIAQEFICRQVIFSP